MQYRRLGKTGLDVSVIGFGGLPLMQVPAPEARILVAGALASGINFFDTAADYGDSEARIGSAIEDRRDEVILATKARSQTARAAKTDVRRACRRLKVKVLDLFQVEGVNTAARLEAVLAPGGPFEGLLAARKAGRIRHIGLTGHNCQVLGEALQRCHEIAAVQFPLNILENDGATRALLRAAAEHGVGTIAMKPLGGGVLPEPIKALRWLVTQPITTAIPGMVSADEVTANAAIGAHPEPLTDTEEADLCRRVAALRETFCRRCMRCEPCPQGIPVYHVLELRQKVSLPQVARLMREMYETSMPIKADACAECGECEDRCPYNLPVIELLHDAHALLSG